MKSYAFLFLILIFLSVEQSFASSWLISPAGKLTSEDKATLKTLQKYQEPLNQKAGTKTPATPIPTTTNNKVLAKQLDAIFSALQKKISS